ncbi:MAG: 2-oxoglutarate dehydrogenase E1 component [Rickettsiaceae bacterium]|nr:MAG: 2-oxoglutarate dehydrogenase E1 component [Rickettsiaceae bacterium]
MKNSFDQTNFLSSSNRAFIEELYQAYLKDPSSVSLDWCKYFTDNRSSILASFEDNQNIIFSEKADNLNNQINKLPSTSPRLPELEQLMILKVKVMISSFRKHGHYLAKLDPLGLESNISKQQLKLNIEEFGFSSNQLDMQLPKIEEFANFEGCTPNELVKILDKTYCSSIGAEFNHVENIDEKAWLFEQIERKNVNDDFNAEEKKLILQQLIEIESFEQYIHAKFPGAKRFSIEGGEACIVAIDKLIELYACHGVSDVVLGMAHRGRLCTLAKIAGKPYRAIFAEFMGTSAFSKDLSIAGDVKYHMGYSSDKIINGKHVHFSLAANPSHLEAVNPIVAGKVRAKQDLIDEQHPQQQGKKSVVGILIHGDAAFCGQGVVAESLMMSSLAAYDVGGISHIVINNQVGFTANAKDTRRGRYATEFAKIIGAPIIHVNGEDIWAVLTAISIAADYRYNFAKDIVIDIFCYRKYGHNETDEPMYTQSSMYNVINSKQTLAKMYANELVKAKIIDDNYLEQLKSKFKAFLDQEYEHAKDYQPQKQWFKGRWQGFDRSSKEQQPTGVDKSLLKEIGISLCYTPEGFNLNSKLKKLFEQRIKTLNQESSIDWATGEQLAFASLINQGIFIRLTGQDCGRGTFSHRHSVLHDQTNENTYVPLNNINKTADKSAKYFVADSNLSEYGVLGFEYGYSQVDPQRLVLWEAQFGDFANGAQIIFDQFISSAETKWLRMSGLVVLLPHGFEGQGPEHSSARLERFLQLAAEDNIYVLSPTTPASFFHMLRRQIYSNTRKPAIVMTPKSLLRHKLAVSNMKDMELGSSFLPVIEEQNDNIKISVVKKVIFCSGKIYYDLIEARDKSSIVDVAIIRFEQLYPFAKDSYETILEKYKHVKSFIWCQEEPQNMGAWQYINEQLKLSLQNILAHQNLQYVGRKTSASPAVGSLSKHNKEQAEIIKTALIT